jgi:hypothetical protein
MAQTKGEQLSLFPTKDTLEEVTQEGLAMLPISNPNQLVALLNMYLNTAHRDWHTKLERAHAQGYASQGVNE